MDMTLIEIVLLLISHLIQSDPRSESQCFSANDNHNQIVIQTGILIQFILRLSYVGLIFVLLQIRTSPSLQQISELQSIAHTKSANVLTYKIRDL
jgi:hypothetical protein